MSDWQKVRVTFDDADGNTVSAVMFTTPEYLARAYRRPDISHDGVVIRWDEGRDIVKVAPIRELPTGTGAVIRVSDYGPYVTGVHGDERDVYITDASGKCWSNSDGDFVTSAEMNDWQYEILSEGVQL